MTITRTAACIALVGFMSLTACDSDTEPTGHSTLNAPITETAFEAERAAENYDPEDSLTDGERGFLHDPQISFAKYDGYEEDVAQIGRDVCADIESGQSLAVVGQGLVDEEIAHSLHDGRVLASVATAHMCWAEVEHPEPREPAFKVTRIIDGDTIELGNGEQVRIVGIDTPERGERCFEAASDKMADLVLGESIRLTESPNDEDRDRWGRLLRYVDLGEMDAGLRMIKSGLAIARYDSRDGYGYHQREDVYIAADKASPKPSCASVPEPAPEPKQEQEQESNSGCHPSYSPCLPIVADLNCEDVSGPVAVHGDDPYRLDGDGNGTACTS